MAGRFPGLCHPALLALFRIAGANGGGCGVCCCAAWFKLLGWICRFTSDDLGLGQAQHVHSTVATLASTWDNSTVGATVGTDADRQQV
jgi:hypothetical protein